jgi:hypothetical protein
VAHEHGAGEIDGHDPRPLLRRHVLERAHQVDPGAVDDPVESAQRGDGLGDGGAHLALVGHVAYERRRAVGPRLRQGRLVAIEHGHPGPFALEEARDREADARGRPGHEHPAPGQSHARASARRTGRSASATSSQRASQTPEWPRMYLISSSSSVIREGRPMIWGCMARQK